MFIVREPKAKGYFRYLRAAWTCVLTVLSSNRSGGPKKPNGGHPSFGRKHDAASIQMTGLPTALPARRARDKRWSPACCWACSLTDMSQLWAARCANARTPQNAAGNTSSTWPPIDVCARPLWSWAHGPVSQASKEAHRVLGNPCWGHCNRVSIRETTPKPNTVLHYISRSLRLHRVMLHYLHHRKLMAALFPCMDKDMRRGCKR